MTESEKLICKMYLEDLDANHSCNEYRILMDLIDAAPVTDEFAPKAENGDPQKME